jgi:hypothetical protein
MFLPGVSVFTRTIEFWTIASLARPIEARAIPLRTILART